MDLIVFGANGPTGRLVVGQALNAGHRVTAVTRRPDQFPVSSTLLDVVAADVTDSDGVARVLSTGPAAVISTFGVPYSRRKIRVYSDGITNITQAMTRFGVERLVCVSSTTVAREEAPGESWLWRKGIVPVLRNVVGRTLYDDMQRMEEIVASSGLNWTVVRPGGLFDAVEPTADYRVSERRLSGRFTSRADLAQVLLKEATEPRHCRSVVEVITHSARPSGTTFLKEAFGIGGGAS